MCSSDLQLMRQGNTQRVVQTGVKRMTRAVEIAAELLEKRAVSQAELKEVQDRMQRLRDAGKDKEKRQFTPLFKKLQAEEERLKNRIRKIDELHRRAIEAQGGRKFAALEAGPEGVGVLEERGTVPQAVKAKARFEPVPKTPETSALMRLERASGARRDKSYSLDGMTYKEIGRAHV